MTFTPMRSLRSLETHGFPTGFALPSSNAKTGVFLTGTVHLLDILELKYLKRSCAWILSPSSPDPFLTLNGLGKKLPKEFFY